MSAFLLRIKCLNLDRITAGILVILFYFLSYLLLSGNGLVCCEMFTLKIRVVLQQERALHDLLFFTSKWLRAGECCRSLCERFLSLIQVDCKYKTSIFQAFISITICLVLCQMYFVNNVLSK